MPPPTDDLPFRMPGRMVAFAVGLAIAIGAACAPARRIPDPDPAPIPSDRDRAAEESVTEPAAVVGGVVHVVGEGETAWRIARVYGISLDDLARANGLSDPTRIARGDLLRIPGADRVLDVPVYPAPLPPDAGEIPRVATTRVPDLDTPLAWPIDGRRILSAFGASRGGRRHKGIDIDADLGDPIAAAADGRVVYAGAGMRGYGKTVILDHGGGLTTLYAHNSRVEVREGDRVERGQVIARAGSTGNASGHHCHFEVRRDDVAVDPMALLTISVAARTP